MSTKHSNENAVLHRIAINEGVDPSTLFIAGDVVYRLNGESVVGTVCQVGTPYWIDAVQACAS